MCLKLFARTLLIVLVILVGCESQSEPLFGIIDKKHPLLSEVFDHPEKHEIQIRYTQIKRAENGQPSFHSIDYRLDSSHYFYPASTVKMPVAFLMFEKLNELNTEHGLSLDENTTITHHSSRPPQSSAHTDSTHHSLLPSLGHYMDKLFVVSDNDAYNRIYEFLGQDYINEKLQEKGVFTNSRIVHRVGIGGFSTDDHRYTNAVSFINENGDTLINLPEQEALGDHFSSLKSTSKGKGYFVDATGETVMQPFDMSKKNFINLMDLESSLMRILFPDYFKEEERYNLTENQYQRVYESLLHLPKDFEYLNQDTITEYYDGYVKFFLYGDSKEDIPDHIQIMNKVGYAYGYLTDCAYIKDTKNDIEFFLTATVHVNENQIYNDGVYEYEEVGIPFLAELGRQIYWYELSEE